MPLRYRRTCLNAYNFRRERSQNLNNGTAYPNVYSALSQIFLDPFTNSAGDFVANRTVALWPTAAYIAGANGVNFDGAGNVQGLFTAGIPTVTANTNQLTWNPNKGYVFRAKNTLFGNFQNGATTLNFGWNLEWHGLLNDVVSISRTLGINNTTGTVTLQLGGVTTDTFNVPNTILNSPQDFGVTVSGWNGANRNIKVSLGGVVVINRTTALQWNGVGTGMRMALQTGNDTTPGTVNIQTGNVLISGYAA